MTRFIAVELAKDHYYSMEAANKDLGYSPIVSIQEGLRQLIDTKESTV
jgi:nucleoside-diphosphate-sugar epimerase